MEIAPGTQFHDVSWRNCVLLDEEGEFDLEASSSEQP